MAFFMVYHLVSLPDCFPALDGSCSPGNNEDHGMRSSPLALRCSGAIQLDVVLLLALANRVLQVRGFGVIIARMNLDRGFPGGTFLTFRRAKRVGDGVADFHAAYHDL